MVIYGVLKTYAKSKMYDLNSTWVWREELIFLAVSILLYTLSDIICINRQHYCYITYNVTLYVRASTLGMTTNFFKL